MSKLYLIPTTLGDTAPEQVLPAGTLEALRGLRVFVVEELRSARRFLSAAGFRGHVEELELHTLNEHSTPAEVAALGSLFERGDVGLITEAGLPAVADPGSALVALCHTLGVQVVPLVGPSSLMLALMASGLDGQSFAFRGYLPAKTEERRAAIRRMEKDSAALRQTQIFIETPYRNDALLADFLSGLSGSTMLCIAADLTLPTETVLSLSVAEWRRKAGFTIGKRPCVFLILAR
ncbi:MAG: SAM-dependent methyltransferase [Bacteroidales bacterium]|nr:SAM-dependent methyltransferase [Bacteroidales bacterium]